MERHERSSGRRGRDDERRGPERRDDERGWREPELRRDARMHRDEPYDYRREGGRESRASSRYPEPQHGAEWGEPGAWHERYAGGGRYRDDPRSDDRRGERDDRGGEMAGFGHRRMTDMEPDWDIDRYDRAAVGGLEGESYRETRRPSHRGRGPRDYQRSDSRIREDVCDALTEHPGIDARDCSVKVEGGEVTLQGTVDSRRVKHMIEDVTCDCSGVKDVHNELRVRKQAEDEREGKAYERSGSESTQRH